VKILSVGNFGRGWDNSICDEEHIAKALEELGHEVTRWQRDNGLPPFTQGSIPTDFILVAQWDGYDTEELEKLKKYFNCPLVYWAFDYQDQKQEWHCRLIAISDLYLSKRIADSRFPNWQWLSQDFAPKFLDKYPETVRKDIDVLFTGSYLPWATERNETIKAVGEKFNLVIHSVNQWPQGNEPPVMDEGLPELYARAKVVLSIDHTIERGYWSDRNFQALACGARVVSRYVPLAEKTFIDKEGDFMVDFFYDIPSCLETIRRVLNTTPPDGWETDIPWSHVMTARFSLKRRVKELLEIVNANLYV